MTTLTRTQLYELVWSKTVRDAAAGLGTSNVGLKKVCVRRSVPVPPQGYWNKVLAGALTAKRPALPPVAPGQDDDFKLFAPRIG